MRIGQEASGQRSTRKKPPIRAHATPPGHFHNNRPRRSAGARGEESLAATPERDRPPLTALPKNSLWKALIPRLCARNVRRQCLTPHRLNNNAANQVRCRRILSHLFPFSGRFKFINFTNGSCAKHGNGRRPDGNERLHGGIIPYSVTVFPRVLRLTTAGRQFAFFARRLMGKFRSCMLMTQGRFSNRPRRKIGPTHQPVETFAALRAKFRPTCSCFAPCDGGRNGRMPVGNWAITTAKGIVPSVSSVSLNWRQNPPAGSFYKRDFPQRSTFAPPVAFEIAAGGGQSLRYRKSSLNRLRKSQNPRRRGDKMLLASKTLPHAYVSVPCL